jgi:UPF0716 family protein affecting phage T7 exclusion
MTSMRKPSPETLVKVADAVFDASCVVLVVAAIGFIWTLGAVLFAQIFVTALVVGFVAVRGAQVAEAAKPRAYGGRAPQYKDEVAQDTVSEPVPPTPEQL